MSWRWRLLVSVSVLVFALVWGTSAVRRQAVVREARAAQIVAVLNAEIQLRSAEISRLKEVTHRPAPQGTESEGRLAKLIEMLTARLAEARAEHAVMRRRREYTTALMYAAYPLLAGGIVWTVRGFLRERRTATRRGRGQCVACGYDLRETPERCPECGAVPA